jgi:hypothetical protein
MDTTTTFTLLLLYPRVNGLQYQGSRLGNTTANQGLQALNTVPSSAGTRNAIAAIQVLHCLKYPGLFQ